MYKSKAICPVCGKSFSPRNPLKHINDYHRQASDSQLKLIRDVRRRYYKQPFSNKAKSLLSEAAIFTVPHSQTKKASASW